MEGERWLGDRDVGFRRWLIRGNLTTDKYAIEVLVPSSAEFLWMGRLVGKWVGGVGGYGKRNRRTCE